MSVEISVILPVFNGENHLPEAVDSLLHQTFSHFELILVDDGSTDSTPAIIQHFSELDPRIRPLYLETNRGVVEAMNRGMQFSRAPLLARMDADDIALPRRLEIQYDFLKKNPGIDLVGCRIQIFPEDALSDGMVNYVNWQNSLLSHKDIRNAMFDEMPVANPTILFRREILKHGEYRQGDFPEDYEFQLRLLDAGVTMAKTVEVLLNHRDGPFRLTRTDSRYGQSGFDSVRYHYLGRHLHKISDRPFLFWGAGRVTRRRSDRLIRMGFSPAAYIDIDPVKIGGRTGHNIPVLSPEDISGFDRPYILTFVRNHGARELIQDRLLAMGLEAGIDFIAVG